jgi:hypothetical protein
VNIPGSILWDDGTHIRNESGAPIDISYSDVQGARSGVYDPKGALVWGEGNIDIDPRFMEDGYHLSSSSPCVNTGYPTRDYAGQTDIDGETRVRYGRVDIGADEVYPIAGEFEPDEDIDYDDLKNLAGHWLDDEPSVDIVPDDIIDFKDVALLSRYWLEGTIP